MVARARTRAEPDEKPAETRRKADASAFGIVVAVLVSALIWPVLICLWLYVLR